MRSIFILVFLMFLVGCKKQTINRLSGDYVGTLEWNKSEYVSVDGAYPTYTYSSGSSEQTAVISVVNDAIHLNGNTQHTVDLASISKNESVHYLYKGGSTTFDYSIVDNQLTYKIIRSNGIAPFDGSSTSNFSGIKTE